MDFLFSPFPISAFLFYGFSPRLDLLHGTHCQHFLYTIRPQLGILFPVTTVFVFLKPLRATSFLLVRRSKLGRTLLVDPLDSKIVRLCTKVYSSNREEKSRSVSLPGSYWSLFTNNKVVVAGGGGAPVFVFDYINNSNTTQVRRLLDLNIFLGSLKVMMIGWHKFSEGIA